MPVEINLLPLQNKKDRSLIFLLLLLASIFLVIALVMYWYGNQVEEQTIEKEQTFNELKIQSAFLQTELQQFQEADEDSVSTMVTFLEEEKVVPVYPLLHNVVATMPEEGYMTLFDYDYPDRLFVEIVFYDLVDVSTYQHGLESLPMVRQVTIGSVIGEEIEEDTEGFFTEEILPHYHTSIEIILNPDAIRIQGVEYKEETP